MSQLGFDELLNSADADNRALKHERTTGHLPDTMEEGLPHFRQLLQDYHAAMLAADTDGAYRLATEAHRLAFRLNGFKKGILAGDDAPGNVLARETAAPVGEIPLWGQDGNFIIDVNGLAVRIEIDGLFGICSQMDYPGFSAHIVEPRKAFLSHTGYRSFLGCHIPMRSGLTPDIFVREVVAYYIADHLGGKLEPLGEKYLERFRS